MAAFGMQLNAATTVEGADRKALERICRYLMRPAFAQDAVEALPDGRVRVHFKTPTRASQHELREKVAPDSLGEAFGAGV